MNADEKKRRLDALLQRGGFNYEFFYPSNIEEPIILIKDYAPATGKPRVSYAFTLEQYYKQNSGGMGSKCWMTWPKVREINNNGPKPHPPYREFSYECNVKYFPFSVQLFTSTYDDINSLRQVCRGLYEYLDFT